MSERRAARRSGTQRPTAGADELPPLLAMGPCIEEWSDAAGWTSESAWFRAMRAWEDAVDRWAVSTGWATEKRPASNARNLARIRHPWSRTFLRERGEGEFVAWLEGRTVERPPRLGGAWNLY